MPKMTDCQRYWQQRKKKGQLDAHEFYKTLFDLLGQIKEREKKIDASIYEGDEAEGLAIIEEVSQEMMAVNM